MLLLLGCDQTEKRFARALETAKSAYESGSYPVVISSLDPYLTIFPENLEIKTLVGLSHVRSGNPFEGAVLLQQAYRADPDLLHFAKEAGQAFKEVGDNESAIEAFRSYLDVFNDDAQSKLSLAQLILEKGRQSEALGLMLEAEKQAPQAIRPIDSLTLGELFMNQGNSVQARRYFSRIESSDDFSVSLPAQLKLIRIAAQDNNWPEVETRIGSMDQQLPGAFDSSDLAPLRQQLADWNAAKLAMEEERRRQEEAAAQAQAELLAAQAEQEATEATEEIEVTPPDDAEPADEPAETPEATTEDSAEALAQTEPAETSAEDTAPPADASSDTQPLSDAELLATDFSPADTSAPPAETEEPTESAPAGTLTPFEEAILRGDAALASQDPETAIDAYYDAQSYDPENSLVWEKLADAYQMQNEGRKAEIALLEAMRHAPEYADLRIRYLRFVQTLGDPAKLMRSIQDAKERFPDNATITLLLARAYERIEQNDRIARFYYNQFIQLAPNDPQVPAVRQRLLGR
ncbi:MAG: tetratricopeptide repeat protein [Opitutales bacterium]